MWLAIFLNISYIFYFSCDDDIYAKCLITCRLTHFVIKQKIEFKAMKMEIDATFGKKKIFMLTT